MTQLQLIDTHCHIHEAQYKFDVAKEVADAENNGVRSQIFVGTSVGSSREAVELANQYDNMYASIGVHPHEAKDFLAQNNIEELEALMSDPTVVAVGEIGFDYFYEHSDRKLQEEILRQQLTLAQKYDKPVIFHVRGSKSDPDDVFADLWRVLADFPKITRAVMHSFTATGAAHAQVKDRGFLIGINGIMTFTQDQAQLELVKSLDLSEFILETDTPYLTPKPFRGTINSPKNVRLVAEFIATIRGETLEDVALATTKNAQNLFKLKV